MMLPLAARSGPRHRAWSTDPLCGRADERQAAGLVANESPRRDTGTRRDLQRMGPQTLKVGLTLQMHQGPMRAALQLSGGGLRFYFYARSLMRRRGSDQSLILSAGELILQLGFVTLPRISYCPCLLRILCRAVCLHCLYQCVEQNGLSDHPCSRL